MNSLPKRVLCAWIACVAFATPVRSEDTRIRIGTFDVDASPPIGSPIAYGTTDKVLIPLRCRGAVILGAGKPIVLCAVDWIGIANESHAAFSAALAAASGTTADRVAVHTLHQHDAPRCDSSAAQILAMHGVTHPYFDVPFARDVMRRAADAVARAAADAKPITHIGRGQAKIEKVASNRRILGSDGRVRQMRFTATTDPAIRAFPVGTIDPFVKLISFWAEETPVAVLSYYATHPQSYYRTGHANPDFPGIARNLRDAATGVMHIHFNGAGGNIGAGKWNDGSPANRQVLADRVAEGMRLAWDRTDRAPIRSGDLRWAVTPALLPPGKHLEESALRADLGNETAAPRARLTAATHLAWLQRSRANVPIRVSCLRVGPVRILHLPGELFVEYQLAAQKLRPDAFVAMAAYGDYGPGYIGTEIAYAQGGYETSPRASRVSPAVEGVLMGCIREVLDATD